MRLAIQAPDLPFLQALREFLANPNLSALPLIGDPAVFEDQGWARTVDILASADIGTRIERVYFGTEFCAWRYRDASEVAEAAALLAETGTPASLVFGPVSHERTGWFETCLDSWIGAAPDPEVVVNDWGTAWALAERDVKVELGRLLFRAKRLPRFNRTPPVPDTADPEQVEKVRNAQIAELSRDPFGSATERAFLDRLDIERYQVDLLPQGLRPGTGPGLPRTLVAPWAYVAGGTQCRMFRELGDEQGRKRCAELCMTTELLPTYDVPTWPLVELGHTVFALSVAVLPSFLRLENVDRVLLEPRIPM